ncbi:unnamed protein product, partial [Durusdinium trenchii]
EREAAELALANETLKAEVEQLKRDLSEARTSLEEANQQKAALAARLEEHEKRICMLEGQKESPTAPTEPAVQTEADSLRAELELMKKERRGRCSDLAARTRRMLAGSGPAVVPNGSAPSGADMASGPSERGERAPVAHDWMRGGRGHVSAADMASGPRMQQEADRPSVLGVAHGEHSWMTGGQVSAADMASGPGVQEAGTV